ncbi:hypothetical protein [Cuniculiplasma sp. SKW4]|uniref:hypothetical protein n=1 Tax=Cuniculiplasma sp. SKW4 TaxID=3400171 RepID=UPI003FD3E918
MSYYEGDISISAIGDSNTLTGENFSIVVNPIIGDYFETYPNEKYYQILEYFCDSINFKSISEFLDESQVIEIIQILIAAVKLHIEYGLPKLVPVYYEGSEKIAYLYIVFENCNWDEWKELEIEIMSMENHTSGVVAVLSLQGLQESKT